VNATGAYRQSRDQLLRLRGEHARAVAEFRWPELGTRFNWAVDWFDAVASGNDRPALVVVEEDGSATERTFAEMSRASDRLSSWLAAGGVRKGDPVLLMLGNQVELWEAMLAIMKLGAVILPTTTAVGRAGLEDRIARGRVRHVICDAADTGTFDQVPGDYTRISVGAAEGWSDLREAADLEHTSVGHPGTTPDDPLLLYFTSGTTSRAGRAHAGVLPGRSSVHDVLAGSAARRCASEHLLTGLGQARMVLLLRAVDRRSDHRRPRLPPLRRGGVAGSVASQKGQLVLCSTDRLANADQCRSRRAPGGSA
jgi:non-ribosomal peptide synthetase component F